MTLPPAIMVGFVTYFQLLNFLVVSLTISSGVVTASPPPVKAAYWPSWSKNLPPSAIDTTLFTHILYAFLMPSNTYKFEIPTSTTLQLSNFTTTLRRKNPSPKTLYSIGGGGTDSHLFARMASDAKSRQAFITSSIETARRFGFDGMDLDWEFPENPKDMQNLAVLFSEWRRAIVHEAKTTRRAPLLLTAAVYFSVEFFLDETYRKFPVWSINQNLDWINVMCYDYHGSWDSSQTGAHAALYDPNSKISTSYGLRSWIKAGLLKSKLVMGLPLYGKTWVLKDPNSHEIGSAAVSVGPGDDGVLTYVEIEEFNEKNGGKVEHDMETVSTYSYAGSVWVGYDDAISTTMKIGFAQGLGIRGYFFWALGYDSDWKISRQASRAWILGD
ncbi:putative Glycosyl hydrolase family protein with chitinase insertion domain [Hibiscus syriacus]|uniref:Glycosyl hydrolase family protein with chitinase insertion domain n=1 Tax=Hibiscus syriacus TaxID=106335 RepID=A0A6A2Z6N8_HIBSY|nr:class V chitinase CHIT5b-like [Hibiscus syriacus]KAE8687651.1 putative Glycosyl hydrolase family protein with chitinase insertion domain [Hibiscus syriacus]